MHVYALVIQEEYNYLAKKSTALFIKWRKSTKFNTLA